MTKISNVSSSKAQLLRLDSEFLKPYFVTSPSPSRSLRASWQTLRIACRESLFGQTKTPTSFKPPNTLHETHTQRFLVSNPDRPAPSRATRSSIVTHDLTPGGKAYEGKGRQSRICTPHSPQNPQPSLRTARITTSIHREENQDRPTNHGTMCPCAAAADASAERRGR